MVTPSLFDTDPVGTPHESAFEEWLAARSAAGTLREASSMAVYRDMWNGFTSWCLGQSPRVTLDSLTPADLDAFKAARYGIKSSDLSLSPRHALRLVRLIDHVLRHRCAMHDLPESTAAADWLLAHPEIRYAEAASADPPPEFLSASEAKHLILFLSSARPRPGVSSEGRGQPLTWQQLRNHAAVALQLGAGLAPGDVRALAIDAPTVAGGRVADRPWKIAVPGNGNLPPRETPIAPWAAELLKHWLQVRAELSIPGEHLFPSTRTGKPWGKESQYRCARELLAQAGLDSAEGGSFRLRHTFALRQLRRGTSVEQVARWLGLEVEAMNKYTRVLIAPADVV